MFEVYLKGFGKQFDTLDKYTYRELRSVLVFLQKICWCAKSSHKQHLFQQHDSPFKVYKSVANTNWKEQRLLMDQDREKLWIDIFHNIEFLLIL